MKKDQLIEEILKVSENYTKSELYKKRKSDLQIILNDLFSEYLGLDDDECVSDIFDEFNVPEDNNVIEIDISTLSTRQKRAYARSGRIPKEVINKYSRFYEENSKNEF